MFCSSRIKPADLPETARSVSGADCDVGEHIVAAQLHAACAGIQRPSGQGLPRLKGEHRHTTNLAFDGDVSVAAVYCTLKFFRVCCSICPSSRVLPCPSIVLKIEPVFHPALHEVLCLRFSHTNKGAVSAGECELTSCGGAGRASRSGRDGLRPTPRPALRKRRWNPLRGCVPRRHSRLAVRSRRPSPRAV